MPVATISAPQSSELTHWLAQAVAAYAHARASGVAALEPVALAATRAAALACQQHLGSGDPIAADGAATSAMRAVLAAAPGSGTVVIGEGEKDGAPMLFNGECLGDGTGPAFDIAVDPLEGTMLCARGLLGALTTIAIARRGALWSPGPAFYMDKLVVGPGARGAMDITRSPEENVTRVADALGRPASELRVVILDKPRHVELIARVRGLGARVTTPSDGDVAGALAALLPGGDADLLMGIGGTPEGVMTACAARALGGDMQGRLAPQREDEAARVHAAGLDVERPLSIGDMVAGPAFFIATGVSGGGLLRAPWRERGATLTESLVIADGAIRHVVEATPSLGRVAPSRGETPVASPRGETPTRGSYEQPDPLGGGWRPTI